MSLQTILKVKGQKVVTINTGATAKQAAEIMQRHKAWTLVVSNGGHGVGVLTNRDLAYGLARHGSRLPTMQVNEIMQPFVSTSLEESTKAVMNLMLRLKVTHIPVLDGDLLVGIVSFGDVLKDRLRDLELEKSVLRDAYIAAR